MALVAAAALLGQACAAPGLAPSAEAPEIALKARAIRYWEVRQAGDLVAQYTFEEPRIRERMSLSSFVRGRGATIIVAQEIREVRVQEGEGVVKVHLRYRPTHPKLAKLPPTEMDLEQSWIWIEGEWYLKNRPFAPPASRRPAAEQPALPEGTGQVTPSP